MNDSVRKVLDIKIGEEREIKPFFITYSVYRIDNENLEVSCTCDGWQTIECKETELLEAILNNNFVKLFDK